MVTCPRTTWFNIKAFLPTLSEHPARNRLHFLSNPLFAKLRSWTIKTIIPLMRTKGLNGRGDYRGKLIKTGFGCGSHGFGQGDCGMRWLSPRLPRVSNQLVTLCANGVPTTAWNRNRNYWFQMDQTQLVSILMNLLHGPQKNLRKT